MTNSLQPTQPKERVVFLDILRGFALMGILFANILSWSGLKFIPIEDIIAMGNVAVDQKLYHALLFFVDTKFYSIFSILFGVGFFCRFQEIRIILSSQNFICGGCFFFF